MGRSSCCVALALAFGLAGVAQANDRPFLLTTSAAAEEDDDAVWAVEAWAQGLGASRRLSVAPEFAFDPLNSVQLELGAENDGNRSAELELRHLFNHIARDGWGWGLDLSLSADNARSKAATLKLPFTVSLFQGRAMLHVNAGLRKASDDRRELVGSLAFEHRLPWRSVGFVEVGREERETLLQAGVRHWVRHDRLAVDFSLQRVISAEGQHHGVVIGVAFYDL